MIIGSKYFIKKNPRKNRQENLEIYKKAKNLVDFKI